MELRGDDCVFRRVLDSGVEIIEGLYEMGLIGRGLEAESLARDRELLGLRSRVALMLAKHI